MYLAWTLWEDIQLKTTQQSLEQALKKPADDAVDRKDLRSGLC